MSEDLIEALQGIHGIGEAKAQEILDVLDDHVDTGPGLDVDELLARIPPGKARTAAMAYLREQDHV